jgi:hypothetical protein
MINHSNRTKTKILLVKNLCINLIPFEPMRLVLYEDKAALSPLTGNSLTVCNTTRTIRVKKKLIFFNVVSVWNPAFSSNKNKTTALIINHKNKGDKKTD